MNKIGFLQHLEKGLIAKRVKDVDEIIADYQEYFDKQLALGKKEFDIISSIGDPDSIIEDYVEISGNSRTKWFETVAVSMVALPLLIINYGLMIVFAGTALSLWSLAVYMTFGLESLSFIPMIPFLPKLFFITLGYTSSIFMMSTTIRYYAILKSMTKQYVVKQTIRIGNYAQHPIYEKIFKISMILMIVFFFVTYIVAALVAKDVQFWHEWEWFV